MLLGHGRLGPGAAHLDEVSTTLKDVVIQSEDREFRHHHGVSALGLARSAKGIVTGRNLGGGSTITMQLARLLWPHRPGILGKVYEIWMALRLERQQSKDWILTEYLRRASFGRNIIGAEAASWAYFGHSSSSLSEKEASLLAAVLQAPSRRDPRIYPAKAINAQSRLIQRLRLDSTSFVNAELKQQPRRLAAHFVAGTRSPAGTWRTTIDAELQRMVEEVVRRSRQRLFALGVDDVAVVIVGTESSELLASVGSIDFDANQVDQTLSPSPASPSETSRLQQVVDNQGNASLYWFPGNGKRFRYVEVTN